MSSEESESDHENEPESDEDESEEWEELATCGTGDEDVRLIVRRRYDDEQYAPTSRSSPDSPDDDPKGATDDGPGRSAERSAHDSSNRASGESRPSIALRLSEGPRRHPHPDQCGVVAVATGPDRRSVLRRSGKGSWSQ